MFFFWLDTDFRLEYARWYILRDNANFNKSTHVVRLLAATWKYFLSFPKKKNNSDILTHFRKRLRCLLFDLGTITIESQKINSYLDIDPIYLWLVLTIITMKATHLYRSPQNLFRRIFVSTYKRASSIQSLNWFFKLYHFSLSSCYINCKVVQNGFCKNS